MAPSQKLPTFEGYEMLGFLGEGKMGMVYKAKSIKTQQVVALKVFKEELKSDVKKLVRFKKEGDILVKVKHKNIINASDFGEQNGLHYYAMEVVMGKDLKEKCDEIGGPLDPRWAMFYCYQASSALQYLNFHGIIHRDLKPANIMIGYDHKVKVCDLSFARTDEYDDLLSKEGCTVGTPNYMSPELARAESQIDIQTDIYSLGASIYYCLVNASPFTGSTPQEVMVKHCEEPLVPPHVRNPKVPKQISDIVCKMMAKTREERYKDPVELLRDIRTVIHVKSMEEQAKNLKQIPCSNCGTLNEGQARECFNCFYDLNPGQTIGFQLFEDELNCPLCEGVMGVANPACPHCGVMICPSCFEAVMPGETECQNCQAKLLHTAITSTEPENSPSIPTKKSKKNLAKEGAQEADSPQGQAVEKQSAGTVNLDSKMIGMILGAVVLLCILYMNFFSSKKPKPRPIPNTNQTQNNNQNNTKNPSDSGDPLNATQKAEILIRQIPALDEKMTALKSSIEAGNQQVEQELEELQNLFQDSRGQLDEETQLAYENHLKELQEKVLAQKQVPPVKLTPTELAKQAYKEGDLAFREGKLDEAKLHFEETLTQDPKTLRAHELLIQIASRQNNPQELILRLKNLKKELSLDSKMELLLGDTYYDIGNYEGAYESYQASKITIQDRQRGEKYLTCLQKANKIEDLIKAYKELSEDRQQGKIYLAKLLRLLETHQKTEEFLAELPRLIEKDPTFYDLPYYRLLQESFSNTLTAETVDRITLKDGSVLEGAIINEQAQYLTFKSNDEDGKQSLVYPKDIQNTEKAVPSLLNQKLLEYLELRKKGDLEKVLEFCQMQTDSEFEKYTISTAIALIHQQPEHPAANDVITRLHYTKIEDGYMPLTAQEFQNVLEKLKKNDLKGALPLLENILKISPNHPEANFLTALAFFEEKEYRKTATAFKKLGKILKGTSLDELRKEAIESAEKLNQLDCKDCKGEGIKCVRCNRGKIATKCKTCRGTGQQGGTRCLKCQGRKTIDEECSRCNGTGVQECKKCGATQRSTPPAKRDARAFYSSLLRDWSSQVEVLGKLSLKYD